MSVEIWEGNGFCHLVVTQHMTSWFGMDMAEVTLRSQNKLDKRGDLQSSATSDRINHSKQFIISPFMLPSRGKVLPAMNLNLADETCHEGLPSYNWLVYGCSSITTFFIRFCQKEDYLKSTSIKTEKGKNGMSPCFDKTPKRPILYSFI